MITYIIKRIIHAIPTLFICSILSFLIIQVAPGDYVTNLVDRFNARDADISYEQEQLLRKMYGLDSPPIVRYFKWISGMLRGNFGMSFELNRPVSEVLLGRLGFTILITLGTTMFTLAVALPIGIFSAVRKYSVADHTFTFISFIGMSIPNFFLALFLLYIGFFWFGSTAIGGLFSSEYIGASWSWGKVIDLLKHLWIPIVVIGTAGTAGTVRIMRGNLLDILGQEHVKVARAKGLRETKVIVKHGVRIAINPLISSMGMSLPDIISGETITAIVLSLPTAGLLFYNALRMQDLYLAGTFLLISAFLLIIGNLLADLALAWVDPRIRFD